MEMNKRLIKVSAAAVKELSYVFKNIHMGDALDEPIEADGHDTTTDKQIESSAESLNAKRFQDLCGDMGVVLADSVKVVVRIKAYGDAIAHANYS